MPWLHQLNGLEKAIEILKKGAQISRSRRKGISIAFLPFWLR